MTVGSARKVAGCISSSGFIGKMTLNVAGITAEDIEAFLSENNLEWGVRSLGEWLGDIAVFFRAGEDHIIANELTFEELQEIKQVYYPSPEEIAAIEKKINEAASREIGINAAKEINRRDSMDDGWIIKIGDLFYKDAMEIDYKEDQEPVFTCLLVVDQEDAKIWKSKAAAAGLAENLGGEVVSTSNSLNEFVAGFAFDEMMGRNEIERFLVDKAHLRDFAESHQMTDQELKDYYEKKSGRKTERDR